MADTHQRVIGRRYIVTLETGGCDVIGVLLSHKERVTCR